ncbi:3-oxoacyl-[acyl-carrier-protein] reductase FabG-like protein [Dinothrombium tinctorium]|uniref:3-oxoacyl-[acyl-carrier-protein] reductase FabG-like protein n=1 Tax=Dinothrombium tinctorium TaxID=1965070 RepID=A0A3S3P5C0_9ACAR|nr:3-oxoacyl-[acyl-carrier-protein] reductase FabG-like protein [Dinothrombium tinctorium]RWS08346.1 3-oxoacyl-[acyl-carrier-protein] reductase FabG-like protein [Dinothrombium tinctorium]RWS08348.1 3-oxoacyl-[acyl-carrier-protein] reductase FabG-like protein [Dinothrombium tinctorium]
MGSNILKDLENKIVLVTGSTSGIGEATVTLFSELGAHVIVCGRDEEKVAKLASKCESLSPFKYKPLTFVGDLLIDENIENLVRQTIERHSRIDVVVNNLAANDTDIMGSIMDDGIYEKFEKCIKTNVGVTMKVARLTLPYLSESKGSMINLSTATTLKTFEGELPNLLSKATVDALTKELALEFGPKGVRVNSVNTAFINTPTYAALGMPSKVMEEMYAHMTVFNRVGQPEEIAKIVVFLASNASSFVTGIHLVADGGFLLK